MRLSIRVGGYFLATTVFAILVGLGLATLARPGRSISLVAPLSNEAPTASSTSLGDVPSLLTGIVPTNPLASMLAGEMLSLVIFAFIVGAALVAMPKAKSEPLLDLVGSVQEICMIVTKWAMGLAPYAVFGLMTRTIASSGLGVLAGLGLYVLTVLGALALLLIAYAIIIGLFSGVRVATFFQAAKDVILLAFSVASSAAVMPLSMKTDEEKLGVPVTISRFVVPLGAIVNMNGTAAYQAVATVFLAQVYGLELSLATLSLVVVTAVAASIGTPSAPGAGIIVLAS
jgi:Na+/H+-dicarboxylate symporter